MQGEKAKFQVVVHFKPSAEDGGIPRTMELGTQSYALALETFSGSLKLKNVKAVILGACPDGDDDEEPPSAPVLGPEEEKGSEQERDEKRARLDQQQQQQPPPPLPQQVVVDAPVVRDNATIVKELCRRIETITSRWPNLGNRGEHDGDGPLPDEEEYHSLMAELRALTTKPPSPPYQQQQQQQQQQFRRTVASWWGKPSLPKIPRTDNQ